MLPDNPFAYNQSALIHKHDNNRAIQWVFYRRNYPYKLVPWHSQAKTPTIYNLVISILWKVGWVTISDTCPVSTSNYLEQCLWLTKVSERDDKKDVFRHMETLPFFFSQCSCPGSTLIFTSQCHPLSYPPTKTLAVGIGECFWGGSLRNAYLNGAQFLASPRGRVVDSFHQ